MYRYASYFKVPLKRTKTRIWPFALLKYYLYAKTNKKQKMQNSVIYIR